MSFAGCIFHGFWLLGICVFIFVDGHVLPLHFHRCKISQNDGFQPANIVESDIKPHKKL